MACLKDSLVQVLGDNKTLIRPLASKTGFSVVSETRGTEENLYSTLFSARILPLSNIPTFSVDNDLTAAAKAAFLQHIGRVNAAQVSGLLVKAVYALNGTRLRQSGGIYWLSENQIDDWEMIGTVVANAAIEPGFQQYVITHELTPGAVLAVKDGLVNDIQTRIAQLHAEIGSGDMGARGLEARERDIIELQNKVLDYEQMLDVSLVDIKKGLESLSVATATAQMLLMAIHSEGASPLVGAGSDA